MMASQTNIASPCFQINDGGMCKGTARISTIAFFPKYYYDPVTHKCEYFVWGGCGGSVPFDTLADCGKAGCDDVWEARGGMMKWLIVDLCADNNCEVNEICKEDRKLCVKGDEGCFQYKCVAIDE